MVDQDFSVVEGTQLHISCLGGEQVEGDSVIRCVRDTMFQYTTQPTCRKCLSRVNFYSRPLNIPLFAFKTNITLVKLSEQRN